VPGQGSTFTLYLPLMYTGPARAVTAPATLTTPVASVALPVLPLAKVEEIVEDDRESIAEAIPCC
jgi:hypothetical protein